MSDAPAFSQATQSAPPPAGRLTSRMTELRVSGHLMTLEPGLFCILQTLHGTLPDDASGLPGVRVSRPPGAASHPEAVAITTFSEDGWLGGPEGAALVRVSDGPAQVLVTIYQSPTHGADAAPRLQVLRLSQAESVDVAVQAPPLEPVAPPPAAAELMASGPSSPGGEPPELVAHVARMGDVGVGVGDWVGIRGSKNWIEGFGVAPRDGVAVEDIEYQAVLGRGWLSPWVEGGKFCGSRGMALPLLGIRVRLRGAAAETHECTYVATFVDGTEVGPVTDGESCEADSLAPLEAFKLELRRKGEVAAPARQPARAELGTPPPRTPRVLKAGRRSS